MASKQDQILSYIIEIKEDVGGIKQHLKDINGGMKRHDESIVKIKNVQDKQEKSIVGFKVKWALLTAGIIIIGTFISNFILNTLLKGGN